MKQQRLKLRLLWRAQTGLWSLSFLVGLLTLLATVLLLASSGWFISAAAAAGVGALFNYMRPGAMIRLFAIVRTAGRYGERLLSHALVLQLLAVLRVQAFDKLARLQQPVLAGGERLQRLIADIDLLDQLPLRLLNPLGWALALTGLYLLVLGWLLPNLWPAMTWLLGLFALSVLLISKAAWGDAQQEVQLQGQRRALLLENLQVLTTLLATGHFPQRAAQLAAYDLQLNRLQRRQQQRQLLLQTVLQLLLLLGVVLLLDALVQSGSVGISASITAGITDSISGLPVLDGITVPLWLALVLGWLGLAEVLLPLCQLPVSWGQLRAAQRRCNEIWQGAAKDAKNYAEKKAEKSAENIAEKISENSGVSSSVIMPKAAAEATIPQSHHLLLQQLQYGFTQALGTLSAECLSGDVVLLQGASGSGKSALLHTIAGELPALAGQITFNQQRLDALSQQAQCQLFGYLPQRPYLFGLTVAAELRLANANASDEQLLAVLALVELSDWLARQPQGLLTVLGEHGVGLSGGELKRFALARLLLQGSAVLLLDEPFAGLQPALAERLLARLVTWQAHGVLLIASHQQQQHQGFSQIWQIPQGAIKRP